MVALSRNVSRKHAMEMLLSGDMVDASRAEQIGLINRAFNPDQLTSETMAMALKIASKSAMTIAIGKRAFYEQAEMPLNEAYAYTSQVMTENMLTRDAEEGIGAFLGKRTPEWQDQ
jgi:enoyl-CoA hydratase/carnithine racemase